MAADNFVALVNAHSRGRSVIKIAEDAGVPPHRIQRYMRPRFVLTKMPTADRMQEIADALDVPFRAVSHAFVSDLVSTPPPAVVESRREAELTAMFRRLPVPYQDTLLQMGRSLSHLERAVSHDGTPESGDAADAM